MRNSHSVTVGLYLDKRRAKKDQTFPVKLRVTHVRQTRLYNTVFSLSKDDFKKVTGEKPRKPYKDIADKLSILRNHAIEIIDNMKEFKFDSFARKLTNKYGDSDSAFAQFEEYISELEQVGRVGNATVYRCALNSLKDFHTYAKLPFASITPKFLEKYEKWMIDQGNSLTSVGIYLRSLRSVFNQAIEKDEARVEDYPFKKYQIPAPEGIKKAISLVDIQKIFNYKPIIGSSEHLYRDLWIFSYLCNGINLKDICQLRYGDQEGDIITFRRAKTSHTNRKGKPITAILTPQALEIIDRWGSTPRDQENFIFRFLKPGMTPKEIQTRVRQVIKQINFYMRRIATSLGINKVTTYTARHSFATVLKNSGVSIAFISEALGHSDMKTTENYLANFELDQKRDISKRLTDFLKKRENLTIIHHPINTKRFGA